MSQLGMDKVRRIHDPAICSPVPYLWTTITGCVWNCGATHNWLPSTNLSPLDKQHKPCHKAGMYPDCINLKPLQTKILVRQKIALTIMLCVLKLIKGRVVKLLVSQLADPVKRHSRYREDIVMFLPLLLESKHTGACFRLMHCVNVFSHVRRCKSQS